MTERKKVTRRDFLRLLKIAALDFTLLALAGGGYGFLIEPEQFKVETVSLKLPRLSRGFSGLRVAQISDIHMGGWMNSERLQKVVDLVIAQKPDLLLITGDFLIGDHPLGFSQQAVEDLIATLSPLAASLPTFAVLGNHDYWADAETVRNILSSCSIRDLSNAVFTLKREGESMHLCGVDDVWAGDVRLEEVIAQLSDDSAAILMAHEPDFADTSAATGRFDLQVSGHTHGGQVALPMIGTPILPYLGKKYPSGLYQVGNMLQYTNRGVGMTRLTIRINCPPEITIFVLESMAA